MATRKAEITESIRTETSTVQLFQRPEGGERAILVQLDDGSTVAGEALDELEALASSAGAEVVDRIVSRRGAPDPRFFIGRGKVTELAARLETLGADLVLVNHTLSPGQERNLERALGHRVLDRTGLILDIFALRARSHEGKLQVELAQLRHVASRLVRGWTHLERQKGGIGLRGPGETQLEMDRRMLGVRIKQVEKRLARVRRQRDQGRQARRKRELPTISLVGYTNAGKSTLFNRLAGSSAFVADQLFATLDTTLRRISLPHCEPAIVADTVGFIRELPHQLVAAFRSTLEEVTESDLLLHVVDVSDPKRAESMHHVDAVLDGIGAEGLPRLTVYNKIDCHGAPPRIERDTDGAPVRVWLSAATGEGIELLRQALAERVGVHRVHGLVRLAPARGRLRARLYAAGDVLSEAITEDGELRLEVRLTRRELERLRREEGLGDLFEPLGTDGALRGVGHPH